MKFKKVIGATVVALGLAAAPSFAATLNVVGGQLMGANDVEIDGAFYDVEFLDGTCVALFGGCDEISDFTFQTQADAALAAQALLDQVFINVVAGEFDSDPALTNGITDSNQGITFVPYAPETGGTLSAEGAWNGSDRDFLTSVNPQSEFDTADSPLLVYASFQAASIEAVPLPAGGLLLLTGLAGVVGVSRRKKRAA